MVTATASDQTAISPRMPIGNVRQPGDFPKDEFVSIDNVPVFTEHEITIGDGRKVRFGPRELQAVTDRCNQRIRETGDFAALTIGHTPSPESRGKGAQDPEVVGFAGPFRLGRLGQRGRYAILADFNIFRRDADKVRKHPRRSPELWLEDEFSDMFLDPIALLGAEAPRLDLGMLYSAERQGQRIERYTAVMPAAGNSFIRSDKYAAETQKGDQAMALTPDEVGQIVDAIEQLDWVQAVKNMLGQQEPGGVEDAAANAGPPAADEIGGQSAPPEGGESQGLPQPPEGPLQPPKSVAEQSDDENSKYAAGEGNAAMWAQVDESDGRRKRGSGYAKGRMRGNWHQSYDADGNAAIVPQDDAARSHMKELLGGEELPDGDDRDQKVQLGRRYAAADEMDEDEFKKYCAYRNNKKYGASEADNAAGTYDQTAADAEGGGSEKTVFDSEVAAKKDYQAQGSADGSDPSTPPTGDAEGEIGPLGDGSSDDQKGNAATSYAARAKYSKAVHEIDQLRAKVADQEKRLRYERATRIDTERLAMLQNLENLGYCIDSQTEIERCKYGRMSDEQFQGQVDFIQRSVSRMPLHELPTASHSALQDGQWRPGIAADREKYSRSLSDKARMICEAKALQGEEPDYAKILEELKAGKA